jgi:hypothetical protein
VLSELDKSIIRSYETSFVSRKIIPIIGTCWRTLKACSYRCTFRPPPPPSTRPPISRKQRVEAMERLLLGLGDQQLATGIAILIASVANRCTMNVLELRIVSCLAWFSATTHSATLKVLREYFYRRPVVRNLRVLGVILFIGLLLYNQVLVSMAGYVDPIKPVQCILNGEILTTASKEGLTLKAMVLLILLFVDYMTSTRHLFTNAQRAGLLDGKLEGRMALNFSRYRWPSNIDRKRRTALLEEASL